MGTGERSVMDIEHRDGLAWAVFRGLRPMGDSPATQAWASRVRTDRTGDPQVDWEPRHDALRRNLGLHGEPAEDAWAEMDINRRVWTIPADRMKARRQHEVPLAAATPAILAGLPRTDGNKRAFAEKRSDPSRPAIHSRTAGQPSK